MYLMSLACVLTLHTHSSLARRSLRLTDRHHMHISTDRRKVLSGPPAGERLTCAHAAARQHGTFVGQRLSNTHGIAWEPQHVLCQVTRWRAAKTSSQHTYQQPMPDIMLALACRVGHSNIITQGELSDEEMSYDGEYAGEGPRYKIGEFDPEDFLYGSSVGSDEIPD